MNPFVSTFSILILTVGLLTNVENANAQSNSTQYDMKSITDNLNKSLTKLTGTKFIRCTQRYTLLLSTKRLTR